MSMARVALSPVYQDYWNFPPRVFGQNAHPWSDDHSILIYLTVGGSMIPLRVLESDSIASVKLRVQKCKGFFARKQKLVFGGKELAHNSSRVWDYGVGDGNILHLVLRLSDLQAISVRTVCGKEFEFHVHRKENVGYVKQQIASMAKGLLLNGQELYCDGEELEDHRVIDDICKSNDVVIHLLVRKSAKLRAVPVEKDFEVSIVASGGEEKIVEIGEETTKLSTRTLSPTSAEFSLEPLTISSNIVLSSLIRKLVDATFDGLERGYKPIRSAEGSGGAYFMQDSSGKNWVSVFKPIDEEPMAVNNPRGLPVSSNGEGLKKGTRVGEGALREVAAYILDHPRGGPRSVYSDEKGFAGVPPTVMVKCRHRGFNYGDGFEYMPEKLGSLQMFVKNSGSCEDMGPRDFPVEEVHKICVLDIRLANADRHGGNILIHKDGEKDQFVLTPIDHGYCLPESFEDCTFEWLYWPQARQSFSLDTTAYINSLDAEKDIELLKFHGWNVSAQCARVFHISTMLLKKGAERGLTPFAIGSIMCRETLKKESVIEKMIEEAHEAVLPGTSESTFLECISVIMDQYLDRV